MEPAAGEVVGVEEGEELDAAVDAGAATLEAVGVATPEAEGADAGAEAAAEMAAALTAALDEKRANLLARRDELNDEINAACAEEDFDLADSLETELQAVEANVQAVEAELRGVES